MISYNNNMTQYWASEKQAQKCKIFRTVILNFAPISHRLFYINLRCAFVANGPKCSRLVHSYQYQTESTASKRFSGLNWHIRTFAFGEKGLWVIDWVFNTETQKGQFVSSAGEGNRLRRSTRQMQNGF